MDGRPEGGELEVEQQVCRLSVGDPGVVGAMGKGRHPRSDVESDRPTGSEVDDRIELRRDLTIEDRASDTGSSLVAPWERRRDEGETRLGRRRPRLVDRPMDRPKDLLGGLGLAHVSACARADHPDHGVGVFVCRERDDLGRWTPPGDLPNGADAASARHPDVHEDHIGLLTHGDVDRRLGVVRRTDEAKGRIGTDQRPEDVDHGLLVVGDGDSDRGGPIGSLGRCHRAHALPPSCLGRRSDRTAFISKDVRAEARRAGWGAGPGTPGHLSRVSQLSGLSSPFSGAANSAASVRWRRCSFRRRPET